MTYISIPFSKIRKENRRNKKTGKIESVLIYMGTQEDFYMDAGVRIIGEMDIKKGVVNIPID